jgi:hypothetical protein
MLLHQILFTGIYAEIMPVISLGITYCFIDSFPESGDACGGVDLNRWQNPPHVG